MKSTSEIQEIKAEVPVFFMEEDAQWVAYCPPLAITTYADTIDEAKEAFVDALQIFLEEMIEQKNLERELLRLGWTLTQNRYRPPSSKSGVAYGLGSAKRECLPVVFPSVNNSASSPHLHA